MSTLLTLSVSLLPLLPLQQPEQSVFSSIDSVAYAENNSAYHLIKGNEVPYHEAEKAFTHNEAQVGTRYNNWSLALVYRYDWFLKFNEDAMALYDALANERLLDEGRIYDVDLDASYFAGTGLRLAHAYNLTDNINLYGAVTYWHGNEFFDGNANGEMMLGESDNYVGNVDLFYRYTEDYIFDRNVSAPDTDYGVSIDAGLGWQITTAWRLSLFVQDLFSVIRWSDAPYTDATLKTANTMIDPDGGIEVDPVMTGFEGNQSYSQHLPEKYQAMLSYSAKQHDVALHGFWAYEAQLIKLQYQYQLESLRLGLSYYPEENGIGAHLNYKGLYLNVVSDDFDYQKASIIGLNMGYQLAF